MRLENGAGYWLKEKPTIVGQERDNALHDGPSIRTNQITNEIRVILGGDPNPGLPPVQAGDAQTRITSFPNRNTGVI